MVQETGDLKATGIRLGSCIIGCGIVLSTCLSEVCKKDELCRLTQLCPDESALLL